MPEIKNTFLKSKMNKDLDSRIIPNGEYRDGQNISVSTSEGADVGALENIRGNKLLTNFNLQDQGLRIIGYYVDTANDRIFSFLTNQADASVDSNNQTINESGSTSVLGNTFTINSSNNYITCSSIGQENTSQDTILVGGSFLNFSINKHICGVNLIEGLLFWTDNRNQPRKINVNTALSNPWVSDDQPGYYYHEDHISVAKYAPYSSPSFIKTVNGKEQSTLINEKDVYLPPIIAAPGRVREDNSGRQFLKFNKINNSVNGENSNILDNLSLGGAAGSGTSRPDYFINNPVKVTIESNSKGTYALIDKILVGSNPAGAEVYLKGDNNPGSIGFPDPIYNLKDELGWVGEKPADVNSGKGANFIVQFATKNPDFNDLFTGDEDLLREKFVRFSYRFKYDDDEYSLTAPYSQHAFVPKQYGYFIGEDADYTKASGIVEFMENQVTTAGIVIDLPYNSHEVFEKLKVKELQLLYKASDEQSVKVISDIDLTDPENINGCPNGIERNQLPSESNIGYVAGQIYNTTGGNGNGLTIKVLTVSQFTNLLTAEIVNSGEGYKIGDVVRVVNPINATSNLDCSIRITSLNSTYIYNYTSQSPIKVLPEKEIVRVSDIVPLRAKTQEAVGNRIIYGNFLQNRTTPNSLNYNVSFQEKGVLESSSTDIEFYNHTLKQGRSYQAGIVLQDRYGRSSNVILNDSNNSNFNSTFYAPYTNGFNTPLSWIGNSLLIDFDEKIPTSGVDYNGIYNEKENYLGWYTYKVVVQQKEQDYYNIYTPGVLSGNIIFNKWDEKLSYNNDSSISNITLFNDNINKIPRDLKEVGPSDRIYSSSTRLRVRVKQDNDFSTIYGTDGSVDDDTTINFPSLNSQSNVTVDKSITTLRPFREVGDWTIYKNVNLKYTTIGPASGQIQGNTDTYIYPGVKGNVDPFFLDGNKNPIISTFNTDKRIGASADDQKNNYYFSKELIVFETDPVKSNLDIYYETSTSGKILDLNTDIELGESQSDQVVLGGVGEVVIINGEETVLHGDNYPITNNFQVLDSNGNVIPNSQADVRISKVVKITTGSGATTDVTGQNFFKVQDLGLSSGSNIPSEFYIFKNRPLIYQPGSNDYIITLKSTINNIDFFEQDVQFNLTNRKPNIFRVGVVPLEVNYYKKSPTYNDLTIELDNTQFLDRTPQDGSGFSGLQVFNYEDNEGPSSNNQNNPYNNSGLKLNYEALDNQAWFNQGLDVMGFGFLQSTDDGYNLTGRNFSSIPQFQVNRNASNDRNSGLQYSATSIQRYGNSPYFPHDTYKITNNPSNSLDVNERIQFIYWDKPITPFIDKFLNDDYLKEGYTLPHGVDRTAALQETTEYEILKSQYLLNQPTLHATSPGKIKLCTIAFSENGADPSIQNDFEASEQDSIIATNTVISNTIDSRLQYLEFKVVNAKVHLGYLKDVYHHFHNQDGLIRDYKLLSVYGANTTNAQDNTPSHIDRNVIHPSNNPEPFFVPGGPGRTPIPLQQTSIPLSLSEEDASSSLYTDQEFQDNVILDIGLDNFSFETAQYKLNNINRNYNYLCLDLNQNLYNSLKNIYNFFNDLNLTPGSGLNATTAAPPQKALVFDISIKGRDTRGYSNSSNDWDETNKYTIRYIMRII